MNPNELRFRKGGRNAGELAKAVHYKASTKGSLDAKKHLYDHGGRFWLSPDATRAYPAKENNGFEQAATAVRNLPKALATKAMFDEGWTQVTDDEKAKTITTYHPIGITGAQKIALNSWVTELTREWRKAGYNDATYSHMDNSGGIKEPRAAAKNGENVASWWSVNHHDGDRIHRLDAEALLKDASGAKECVVVSAYLVQELFENVLKALPPGCAVALHLEESELRRKPALRDWLGKQVKRPKLLLRIWLHRAKGIFHPKMYAFRNGRGWTIWAGSANATTQAFADNEELMLRARGPIVSPLIGYIERLEKHGRLFVDAEVDVQADDVRAFLLKGQMYFVRDWNAKLRLPLELGKGSTSGEEANSPAGLIRSRGKLAFDVAAALGVEDRDKGRSRIKRLSVATCYGLWGPEGLREEIESDRELVRTRRAAILDCVWKANQKAGDGELRKRFFNVLGLATGQDWMSRRDRPVEGWKPGKAFDHFYERLFGGQRDGIVRDGKLSPRPELRSKAAEPLYDGVIPDVFSSKEEAEDFVDSFFDSLETESFKPGSKNRIWRKIRDFCRLDGARQYEASEIRKSFEDSLKELEFKDERWSKTDAGEDTSDEDAEDEEQDE